MRVKFSEIRDAYDYVSFGGAEEHHAVLCKETGQIYFHSDYLDNDEDEWPDDIDDNEEKYIAIPNKRELGLGKRLVFAFVQEFLQRDLDQVQRIFSRKGAYATFKDLLMRRGALDQWYAFETKAEDEELRKWCELNDIELIEDAAQAQGQVPGQAQTGAQDKGSTPDCVPAADHGAGSMGSRSSHVVRRSQQSAWSETESSDPGRFMREATRRDCGSPFGCGRATGSIRVDCIGQRQDHSRLRKDEAGADRAARRRFPTDLKKINGLSESGR